MTTGGRSRGIQKSGTENGIPRWISALTVQWKIQKKSYTGEVVGDNGSQDNGPTNAIT